MVLTVLVWTTLIFMSMIAIGFIFSAILFLIGMIGELIKLIKKDPGYDSEGMFVFSVVTGISVLMAAACIFAVLRLWGHVA